MTSRIALVFIASVLIFQVLNWSTEATVIRRRDVTVTPKPSTKQTIEEAFNDFKSGIDNLVKDVQDNKLVQNVTNTLQNFGDQIKQAGEDFVQKIKGDTPKN